MKRVIEQRVNGPLKFEFKKDEIIKDSLIIFGEKQTIDNSLFFCRCGKSPKQPFCDGSHKKNGFNDKNECEEEIIQTYKGKDITIIFNRSICCGSANCVKVFPNIYKSASVDWINPDGGSADEVIQSIKACPSGALSYELHKEKSFEKYEDIKIEVIKRGPLLIKGDFELKVEKTPTNANSQKFTLCRCGSSKNKPFCDYSHASLKGDEYTF